MPDMSVGHNCGKSSAAKRGRHTKPILMAMTDTNVVTLEELQKGDRGWFAIKPTVTIVARIAIPISVVSYAD